MKSITIFVDGSFSTTSGKVGWGWISSDRENKDSGGYEKTADPDILKQRNVSGEIKAAMKATEFAIENKYDEIIILHDYTGVMEWVAGNWKAKNKVTQSYQKWMQSREISIVFAKVDSSMNPADELARQFTGAPSSH